MSNIPNFRELLSKPTDSFERPRPLAVGHYVAIIRWHEFDVSKQKQTPFVRFLLTTTEETTDVPDGANAGTDITQRELRATYYITPQSLYRLSDMLDAVLGKQVGRSFDQRIPETRGVRVIVEVTQREQKDDDGNVKEIYNEVGTIIAAG